MNIKLTFTLLIMLVVLPALWETQGYRSYNGIAWYRNWFMLPPSFNL